RAACSTPPRFISPRVAPPTIPPTKIGRPEPMTTITRRHFLTTTIAAGTGLLGAPPLGTAQGKEIVMLGIWPFTGAFADVGPLLDRGMKLAIEEWGNKVIGRPIKYITRDDETKASSATRRMEEAIDSEGVKIVIGPWSIGIALA